MGYDLHITRASDWLESESVPISLDEWKTFIVSDREFQLDNYAEVKSDKGESIRYENEGLAVWTRYSGHGQDGNMAWFDFRDGRIVVKNPDDEILAKMKQVAGKLNAKVIGDDHEEY